MKNVLAILLVSMSFTSAMASAQSDVTSIYSIYASGKYLSLESPGIMIPAGSTHISGESCTIYFIQPPMEDSILSAGRKIEALQMQGLYDGNRKTIILSTKNDKTVSAIAFKGATLEDLEKACGLKATVHVRTDLLEASLQK